MTETGRIKKRRLLYVLAGLGGLLLVSLLLWQSGQSGNHPMKDYIETLHQHHLRRLAVAESAGLVFAGDSHIQGLDVSTVQPGAVNLGIGGLRSRELTPHLAAYRAERSLGTLVIAVGINDLLMEGPDAAQKGLAGLFSTMNAAGERWYFVEILPVDGTPTPLTANAAIRQVNGFAAEKCQAPCEMIAVFDAFEKEGRLDPALHEGDGLHLNRAGYDLYADIIRSAIEDNKGGAR